MEATIVKRNETISEYAIFNLMKDIGIPCNMLGYKYLKAAIIYVDEDDSLLNCVVNGLYSKIADTFNTTISKVERNIRNAIDKAFVYGGASTINDVFGMSYNPDNGKPTNSEFIANSVEYLRLTK